MEVTGGGVEVEEARADVEVLLTGSVEVLSLSADEAPHEDDSAGGEDTEDGLEGHFRLRPRISGQVSESGEDVLSTDEDEEDQEEEESESEDAVPAEPAVPPAQAAEKLRKLLADARAAVRWALPTCGNHATDTALRQSSAQAAAWTAGAWAAVCASEELGVAFDTLLKARRGAASPHARDPSTQP